LRWPLQPGSRYLVLSIAAAALAGVFAHIYLSGLAERVPVVVAARDFGPFTRLDQSLLKIVLLPSSAVHPLALARAGEAVGLVTLVPRAAGEQVLSSTLVTGENPGEYRAVLGPSERALFLTADSVHGGWIGVEKGDYVDLIVVLHGTARCVGSGLEVLEVMGEASASLLGARSGSPVGVFLRVTPALGEVLALAVGCGKVYVSVNGYSGIPVQTTGTWIEQLYGEGGGPGEVFWP